jgi:hypothetical protein
MTVSFSATGEAPPNSTNNAYLVFQQFTSNTVVTTPRVIDVDKDLQKFSGTAALELLSRTGPTAQNFTNNAAPGDIQSVNFATANLSMAINGDMSGVSLVQLVNAGTTTQVAAFAIGTGTATANLSLPTALAGTVDILITVNGTEVLDDRNFNYSVTLAPAGDIVQGTTLVDPNVAFPGAPPVAPGLRWIVWATNGTQFISPFLRNDPSAGVSSVVRLENVTGADRNYWTLVDNNGRWAILASKVPFPQGADNPVILLGSDIVADAAAIGITLPPSGFAFRVVVDETNSPQNVSGFASQQQVGSGFRNAPMLKKSGWTE